MIEWIPSETTYARRAALFADHPPSRLHELLPWHWKRTADQMTALASSVGMRSIAGVVAKSATATQRKPLFMAWHLEESGCSLQLKADLGSTGRPGAGE
jgi:hypothetical protein